MKSNLSDIKPEVDVTISIQNYYHMIEISFANKPELEILDFLMSLVNAGFVPTKSDFRLHSFIVQIPVGYNLAHVAERIAVTFEFNRMKVDRLPMMGSDVRVESFLSTGY